MQFSVPQFTDVEDRIIGGLSFKQFGIVFVAGVITFAVFGLTGNITATIIAGIILGIPALVVTFGKINGRPIYLAFAPFLTFITGQKTYVFHKEAKTLPWDNQQTVVTEKAEPVDSDHRSRRLQLKKMNYVLQQQASEENVLIDRINESEIQKQKF